MLAYERIDISDGIDVSQMNQKSACSVIIGIFKIRTLTTGHIFVMDAIA